MLNEIVIGISDQKITKIPNTLVSYALGSCVGICLYDRLHKIAGLAHILLPKSEISQGKIDVYKYADTAIENMMIHMEKQGCHRSRLTAKISGGANMFATTIIGMGDRNVKAVKEELNRLGIKIIAEDVGGNYGRTLVFNPESGELLIKSIANGNKSI
jgi:chemotaxis protein CheD